MNIYIKELKLNLKILLGYSIITFFFVLLVLLKYDIGSNSQVQALQQFSSKMPAALQYLLGMNPKLDLSKFDHYLVILFNYTIIIGTLFSLSLGTNLILKEHQTKTIDFLYSKTKSRSNIIFQKMLVGFTYQVIFIIILFISIIISIKILNLNDFSLNLIISLLLAHFIIQIIFYALGIVTNGIKNKNIIANSTSITIIFSYLANVLTSIFNIQIFDFLTPLKYLDFTSIVLQEKINYSNLLFGILAIIILYTLFIKSYQTRDL